MLENIYDAILKSDDIRVGRNNTKGIFMKIFFILLTFAVNILLSGYNNQQIYVTTVVENAKKWGLYIIGGINLKISIKTLRFSLEDFQKV